MRTIDGYQKLKIFLIGVTVNIIVFLMIHAIFALIFTDYLVNLVENDGLLILIIISLFLISSVVSTVVGIWVTDGISQRSILITSIMAYLSNFLFIIVLSYLGLFIFYPNVFSEVEGLEILLILPSVLVYFSIYVLKNPIFLFILSSISYFAFFVLFINSFFEFKLKKVRYEPNYRW